MAERRSFGSADGSSTLSGSIFVENRNPYVSAMPGIAGIITPAPKGENRDRTGLMVQCMQHEPFYASGILAEAGGLAAAGWVCHRDSYSDCQPIWNEKGDIGLVFAGEHYADPNENVRLRAAGHRFNDDDASCLVHLYEEHGAEFFPLLNGTFSGLLVDRRENKVILFNDRYGLGRVYYHEGTDGFYFASEAKAILKVLPALRALDPRGLGELLACGCTLQDRTLFPGIFLLPPGSLWTFRPGQAVRRGTYFDRSAWEAQTPLPAEEYYQALKATFDRILPRYFRGRQRVALSITGGLDSRMIIAGVRAAPGELPCYTFGGTYRESEDVKVGRLVAGMCQQTHQVIKVDERFFPHFLDLAQKCVYVTDGAMDVSGAVGLYVNRQARDFAPVRMTGNYGSEILRLSVAFKPDRRRSAMLSEPVASLMRQAAETYDSEKSRTRLLSFIAYKQVPWHHYARLSEEQTQLTIRAPYLDNDLVPLAYRAPSGLLLNKHLGYRYAMETQPALAGAPTDRGMLRRPPFVPRKLFELSLEVRPRAEYYFDYGMPQWLAKADRLLSPLKLERLFLGQQKYYHFRTWYRHALASVVKEVLLDPRTLGRSYLERSRVESLVRSHTRGAGNFTTEIHKLLTVEFIERQLIAQA
jgi:asparagine synthase (glutamine-hydrolysing)